MVKCLSPKHQWILLSGNEEKNIPHYNHSEIQPIPGIPKVRVRIENKSSGDDFKKHFRCVNKSKYVSEKIDVRIFSIQSWEDLKGLTA